MVPPTNRRPGFSRRRQYGLFFAQVIAVAGVLVGALLVAVARFDPNGLAVLRGVGIDLTAPIAVVMKRASDSAGAIGRGIGDYIAAGGQNGQLRAELARSRQALTAARAIQLENLRLKRVLRIVEPQRTPVVVARLAGSTAIGTRRYATLTAGASDGVRPGQPVLAPEGLIGRVLETGSHAARVMLLTDESNVLPVRLARDGTAALATGSGDGRLDVRSLNAGAVPFRRGDLLVTSGAGGLYPPGVPAAVITRVSNDGAVATPLADPGQLDFAVVEPIYRAALPAPPAPMATVVR